MPAATERGSGGGWGEGAELHHQSENIHQDACVFDAALFQAIEDEAPDADEAPCGGDSEKGSLMRAGPLKAAGHFVAFGNLFLNVEDKIGEGGSHGAKNIL